MSDKSNDVHSAHLPLADGIFSGHVQLQWTQTSNHFPENPATFLTPAVTGASPTYADALMHLNQMVKLDPFGVHGDHCRPQAAAGGDAAGKGTNRL